MRPQWERGLEEVIEAVAAVLKGGGEYSSSVGWGRGTGHTRL